MNKPVKWISGIILLVLALIIIIPLCLPLFIDPNDYKGVISEKVQEQTGRTLAIPGDIDLDFSLVGLETVFQMGEVSLSASSDFPGTKFFDSKLVEVHLALWPLLKNKELKVSKIRLEGVGINLVKNAQGNTNWEDLAGEGKTKQQPERQEQEAGGQQKGLAGFDIGSIEARDISMSYSDEQVGRTVKLNILNLATGNIREGQPFPFETDLELSVQEKEQPPMSGKLAIKSGFMFSLADSHFIIDDLVLKSNVKAPPAPEGIDFELAANIDLALQQEKIEISKLTFKQGDMELQTNLTMTGLADPQLKGSLNIPSFSPRAKAEAFGIQIPTRDPKCLTKMSAQLDFSGDLAETHINNLSLNLDDTMVTGEFSVKNYLQPAFDLALQIDQLDLDRYAAATEDKDTAPAEATPDKQQEGEQVILPAEMLRQLNFNADVTIGKLKAAKLNLTNIRLNADGKEGLIRLNPLAADFYDGTIDVTADINAVPDSPEVKLNQNLKGVQLGPMFVDLAGKEEIKGRADIQSAVTSRGETGSELKRNANGRMSISLADGEIAKLKIIDTIRTAKALVGAMKKDEPEKESTAEPAPEKPQTQPKTTPGRSTTFASLKATGVITNGVFKNDDLMAESELMRVEGGGTVDLVREQIDYLLTIYLAKTIDRNQETGLVDLADTPIPYRVQGTFDQISQSAALEEIVKTEAKKLIFKEIEKQFGGDEKQQGETEKSSDPAKDLLNKGLKSLFGN